MMKQKVLLVKYMVEKWKVRGNYMKKKILFGILFLIANVMLVSIVFADWKQVGDKWTYEENGTAVKSTWKLLKRGNDYSSYYFDENGYMVTGVWKIDNEYYSFKKDGISNSKSVVEIDGEKYSTGNKGLIEEFPSEYSQDNFKGEWQTVGANYKYIIDGVPLVSTWRLIYSNDKLSWFYFDENGFMVTGLRRLPDNNFYFFGADGAAVGNSKVSLHEYGSVETLKKGQITSLPNGFDINQYEQESKVAKEEASKAEESRKLQAAQQTTISPEESQRLAQEEKNKIAAAEAQKAMEKAAKEASKVSLLSTENGVFTALGDEDNTVVVQYQIPVLKGGNSAALNAAINSKLEALVHTEVETRLSGYTKKNVKLTVTVKHDMDANLVRLRFSGDKAFTILLNPNTLDMWAEY